MILFYFLLQGNGDSEIALVVEDEDMINSTMNGMPYPVGRFAATLRRQLYKGMFHFLSLR
jgi:phospholipase D1/2